MEVFLGTRVNVGGRDVVIGNNNTAKNVVGKNYSFLRAKLRNIFNGK